MRGCSSLETDQRDKVLQVVQILLDQNTYQAVVDRRRIDLAWMEFQLLKFLMRNRGRVFWRAEFLANVWGFDNFGGTRTVDVHIRRLRSKLGIKAADHFRTVKNVGYGLFAEE